MKYSISRREIIKASLVIGSVGPVGIAAAQTACFTGASPEQPEGPFYPIKPQKDVDADLTFVEGKNQLARGEIVELRVRVLDESCQPIESALVDLWQACATGKYNHPADPNPAELDPNFQYWARLQTDADGYVSFRTIKPGAYPAANNWIRPPHIHFKISAPGFQELTTQMYFAGEALNRVDKILAQLPVQERNRLIVRFDRTEQDAIPKGLFTVQLDRA